MIHPPTPFGLEVVQGRTRYPSLPLLAPQAGPERSQSLQPSDLVAVRERTRHLPLFDPPAEREMTKFPLKEDDRRWILLDLKTEIWYPLL